MAEIIPLYPVADGSPGLSVPCADSTESKRSMAVPIIAPVDAVTAIARALALALAVWCDERDARSLRRALLAVLTTLDEAQ